VKHKDPYVLPEILVVPLLTRMVTKVIRQSSSRESLVKGALQATSMGSGPIKMLVFKSLQKEYPFMDPSGRLDNVYTVAEFHARTLTTFYIDDMNDLRALLAISDLKTRMPSLQRIQTNFKILGHLAQSVTCLSAFSPGYFPTIDLVLTDKMTDLTELKGLLTTYPAFAQYVSGIGFSQSIPNVSMLGEVIKILPKNKSIEIDSNFLQNHHLQTLKSLRQKIVLRPGLLVEELNTYLGRHHAYRLDVSIPMNGKLIEQKNKIINLLEGWSRSGISLGLTMETKSLLAMPEKK